MYHVEWRLYWKWISELLHFLHALTDGVNVSSRLTRTRKVHRIGGYRRRSKGQQQLLFLESFHRCPERHSSVIVGDGVFSRVLSTAL